MDLCSVLFSESIAGPFGQATIISDIGSFFDYFGMNVDEEILQKGLSILEAGQKIVLVRVREKGASLEDYYLGLRLLADFNEAEIVTIALLGISDQRLLKESILFCRERSIPLVMAASDLYDLWSINKSLNHYK